jgi:hypothetical protein
MLRRRPFGFAPARTIVDDERSTPQSTAIRR